MSIVGSRLQTRACIVSPTSLTFQWLLFWFKFWLVQLATAGLENLAWNQLAGRRQAHGEGRSLLTAAPSPLPPCRQFDFVKTLTAWLWRQCLRWSEIPHKTAMGGWCTEWLLSPGAHHGNSLPSSLKGLQEKLTSCSAGLLSPEILSFNFDSLLTGVQGLP